MMFPAASWLVVVVPRMATRNWEMHIPTAPQKRTGRRPHLSIAYSPGNVEAVLTQLVIKLMTKEL